MFRRMGESLRRFMYGRNGSDQLNMLFLISAVVLTLVGSILSRCGSIGCRIVSLALSVVAYGLLVYAVFRMLSRNLYARQKENRRFTNLLRRLKDRSNRYFRCPHCKQTVRVPRNRGKICIKCPKCGEKFIRKT